jgi:hypothetical protein
MTPRTFSADFVRLDMSACGRYARLVLPLAYRDARGRVHVAHAGMPTDGLSIPRLCWRVAGAPLRHPYLRAGVIHDHYCHLARALPPGPDRDALRLGADMLFREMVDAIAGCRAAASGAGGSRAERVSAWVRRAMRPATSWAYYRAVRMGAWTSRRAAQWPNYALHPAEHLAAWTAEM